MSYIGKILVVLQLVLSVCLMAFAAAVSTYQTNWKAKTEQTQKQLDDQRTSFAKLEQESKAAADKFNADLKAEGEKAREAGARASQLGQQNTLLASENKRLSEEAQQKTQINTDLVEDSNARQNEVKIVREKLKAALADRDLQYKAKAALEDKIFEQDTKIERLAGQNKMLLAFNQQYRDVLNSRGLPLEIEEYQKAKNPPPKVDGVVMDTKKQKNGGNLLIEISIGENDGLSMGNELFVYRGGEKPKFLGKARIMGITADAAVCELIKSTGLVEKGDNVTTKLN
ncbi:MAG: hypothetical protein JWN70_2342 [Planctomycetaceae bacterium]|nr:hypothetical protein [Planctomycetaceae bacterium]